MNITTLLLAALASWAIGALWFSPYVFGKIWARLSGVELAIRWWRIVLGFIADLVKAYVVAIVVASMGAFSIATGLEAGFWLWLGFVATIGLFELMYEKRPRGLVIINFGYYLVSLLVMGAILATW